jgi:hypothetical protein
MAAVTGIAPTRPASRATTLATIRFFVALPLSFFASLASSLAAQPPPQASEYELKAAFLLNFTKFVIWPSAAFVDGASPLAICILGDDPFDSVLDQLVAGEEVNGRKLLVRRIQQPPMPKTCHVLFFTSSQKDVPSVIAASGSGVLTVGETDAFLREGGIIAFVVDSRRVRFDINLRAASNASLTLSARLLSVARSVRK